MSIYNIIGESLLSAYHKNGASLDAAYDKSGNIVFEKSHDMDYSNYSFSQKWESKGISSTQGFDIYNDKVFWVQKSGNSTIPANCYVWNLADGSQALSSAYITVYSGHGNNLCFDFPTLYATSAYTPHVYVNEMTDSFVATLVKTLYINDGCVDCDACVDETDKTILWSLGHTGYNNSDPFLVSKWDLSNLTDNGDGTYTPKNIQTVTMTAPSTSRYFQGLKSHDGLLWYGNGSGSEWAYVRAIDPNGTEKAVIDLATKSEPEGVAWIPDNIVYGGYVMYVGFQGMMLRKYTFGG